MSNIKKITLNMNRLAQHFGKPISKNTILSYTFPAPGTLNNLQTIQNCATGFRAKYIHAANSLVDDSYFEKLRKKTYENAHEKLMELPGVGDKVADCICLFALGKTEAFPVDVWISRIMSNTYFDGKPIKNQLLKQFAKDRWGKNAGLAQQFLYHWGRNGK